LNVTYALRRSHPDGVIALEASAAADAQSLFWFDGDGLIGNVAVGAGALPWRPTVDGPHLTRAIDDHGRAAERDVRVDFAP
jgi:penicillin-binding protein 1C